MSERLGSSTWKYALWLADWLALAALAAFSVRYLDGLVATHMGRIDGGIRDLAEIVRQLSSPGILVAVPVVVFMFDRFELKDVNRAQQPFYIACVIVVAASLVTLLQIVFARRAPGTFGDVDSVSFDFFQLSASLQAFPSLEAAGLFGLATAIALTMPKYASLAWSCGILAAIAGIVTGHSWVSDIVAGGAIGMQVARTLPCSFRHSTGT